jgi:hypothetical protein
MHDEHVEEESAQTGQVVAAAAAAAVGISSLLLITHGSPLVAYRRVLAKRLWKKQQVMLMMSGTRARVVGREGVPPRLTHFFLLVSATRNTFEKGMIACFFVGRTNLTPDLCSIS